MWFCIFLKLDYGVCYRGIVPLLNQSTTYLISPLSLYSCYLFWRITVVQKRTGPILIGKLFCLSPIHKVLKESNKCVYCFRFFILECRSCSSVSCASVSLLSIRLFGIILDAMWPFRRRENDFATLYVTSSTSAISKLRLYPCRYSENGWIPASFICRNNLLTYFLKF